MVRGRFAPSPSGRMHLGNVFSALLAWLSAKSKGGEIVLRVEDLDPARSRREYAEAIMADFQWLGLHWDRRAENQSLRGQCEICGKTTDLINAKIVDSLGTRYRKVCKDCFGKNQCQEAD